MYFSEIATERVAGIHAPEESCFAFLRDSDRSISFRKITMLSTQTLSPEMQQCIQNCSECHRSCTETASHCLQMGGKHASADHIRTLLDCAQMCGVSTDFMLRQSPIHPQVCGVCAETCRQCAESCSRLADGDAAMQRCAAICRQCAQSCESMSKRKAAA